MRIIISILLLALCFSSYAQVYVKGYYKKDGTYVQPHYRSSPNSTKMDNYSTKGNINPYTGKEGNKRVDNIVHASRSEIISDGDKKYNPIKCPLGLTFGETDKGLIRDAMKRKLMCDSIRVNALENLESYSVSFAGDFYDQAACIFIDGKLYRISFTRFVNHFDLAVMLLEDLYGRLHDKYGECEISTIYKEDEYISLTWVDDDTDNAIILLVTKNNPEDNYFCKLWYESNTIQEESSNNEL